MLCLADSVLTICAYYLIQGIVAVNLMNVVRAVKVLVLRMSPPSVDDAIDFMTFFPCLEKLYILVRFVLQSI